jgi:hypothetical protein
MFDFFTLTLITHFIQNMKSMGKIIYVLKIHYVINYIIVKIKKIILTFFNKMSSKSWCRKSQMSNI